MINLLIFLHFN